MSKNWQNRQPDEKFFEEIRDLKRLVSELQRSARFVPPKYTSDPSDPLEGEVWVNTTSHQIKIYLNSTVKVFDLT